jgi:hypothetical protein
MSADGRLARDVMFGLMKTCQKLGISFVAYLGNCLGFNRAAARILQCPIWWAPDRRKFIPSRNRLCRKPWDRICTVHDVCGIQAANWQNC